MLKNLSLLLFIIFATQVMAQHSAGLQAGLNLANISAKEAFTDVRNRYAFTGGVTYQIPLWKTYSLNADLIYSGQGFVSEVNVLDETGSTVGKVDYIFRYNYVSLPLKIGHSLKKPEGSMATVTPRVGISPSFLIAANTTTPKIHQQEEQTTSVREDVTGFDIGGLIELGVDFALSERLGLLVNVTYRHSFNTFSNEDYFSHFEMKHRVLSVITGLRYTLSE